jgi:DNA-binding IclR family transcriptional regulator
VDAGYQPVKSADRTLEVLEVLASSPNRRGLGELARELGIPKSSLHGILRTMAKRGWVEADPTGTRFGLGVRALQVGAAYLDADSAVGLVAGVLDELAAEFGETVHLGRLDGAHVVYLAKRESVHPLRLFSAIGRRLPAHATALGKVLLAERSAAQLDAILPDPLPTLTPRTITDRAALDADLARVREQGYAVDHEENTDGIACFAVAVPYRQPATDAISISVPVARLRPGTAESMIAALRRGVTQLRSARSLVEDHHA